MRTSYAAVLLMAICGIANAQSTGTISGRVTDQSGAAMPGATVSATNPATGIARDTVTNTEGIYSIPALQPGQYDIKVKVKGFADQERKDLTLVTGATSTLDFSMSVANVTENVSVSAEGALVETTESTSSSQLRVQEVQNLPMINRNFQGLMQLLPGARPAPVVNSTRQAFGNGIGVAGGSGRNVTVLMDGEENRDEMIGGPSQNYTIEGIQEFRAIMNDFGAQYGGTNGAVVQVTTKSGTNQLHGGAFYFGRNDTLTATDYFVKAANGAKPPYDRKQYGGSLGGHIIKDKLFYFGAVERIQQDSSIAVPGNVFNEAVLLAKALPQLNNNPVATIPRPYRDTMYTLKADYQLNPKNALLFRFAQQRLSADNDQLGATHPDLTPHTSNNTDRNNLYSIVGSYTYLISNSTVNTFGFQRSYYTDAILCDCGPASPAWVTQNLVFPSLNTGRTNNTTDQSFFQDKYSLRDDVAAQIGRHSLKVGVSYAWYPQIGFQLSAGCSCTGATTFFDDPSTIINNTNGKYPLGFLTPGIVRRIDIGTTVAGGPQGNSFIDGQKSLGSYVQDDWKISSRVTVNLGLRYDLQLSALNPSFSNNRELMALKAIGNPYGSGAPRNQKKDFSPRVGVAWDVTGNGRNVLRASGALMYDPYLHVMGFRSALLSGPTIQVATAYLSASLASPDPNLAHYIYGVSPLPPGPPATPTSLPAGKLTQGDMISPTYRDARTYVMHVGFSHQLGSRDVLSADYSHIIGLNGLRARELNPIENAWDPTDADQHILWGTRRLAPAFAQVLGDANILSAVNVMVPDNRMRYDEMIIHYERRTRRASFQGSYTLSQSGAYGGIFTAGYGGGGIPTAVNTDLMFGPGEWGPTVTDERHRVVLSGVFDLPWGIQAAPILQAASARPYNLISGTDSNKDGQALVAYSRDQWVDPATGRPVSVNSQRGDPSFDLDARVSKFFNLGSETRRIGVFAEFYNITNRANFGQTFQGNGLSPTFRQPNGFMPGLPTSRQMQWGIRFSF